MFNDDRGVNQSSGEDSVGKGPAKEPAFAHFNDKSVYPYSDDELGKKKEVNSMGSRLYVCAEIVKSSVLASNLGHNILLKIISIINFRPPT